MTGPHSGRPLRLGLVGLGVIARFYLAAIERAPQVELAAVCDRRADRLDGFAARGVRLYDDWREIVCGADIDAVAITLPNDLHATVAIAAAQAGKHVCCEKPLAITVADAEEVARDARAGAVTLFTAFHRRYNDHLRRARAAIAPARPVRAHVDYLESIDEHAGPDRWYLDPARCGGGCLADNGPNAFDSARALLGPLHVREARVRTDADTGVDVGASVELVSDAGAHASVELAWDYAGERKAIGVELDDGRSLDVDFLDGFPAFKSSLFHEYVGVLDDFRRCVETGAGRAEEGVEIARLIADAYAAAGFAAPAVGA